MSLVPSWAHNLHPLVIHFPIVLLVTALAIALIDILFEHPAWLGAAATVAAYLTGVQARSTVVITGMAHSVVDNHRTWALFTAW